MITHKVKNYAIIAAVLLSFGLFGLICISFLERESEGYLLSSSEDSIHIIRQLNDKPYKIQIFIDSKVFATYFTYGPVIEKSRVPFEATIFFKTVDGVDVELSSSKQNPWILFDPK